jgi:large subunit ribosomal protein L13e
MVKHNNVIPNQHFKKKWQFHVKTWFNQPARKVRRRNARDAKAVKAFPRPTAGPLRPIVHGQTLRYQQKRRSGRGFTHEELKEAGIPIKMARSIGVSVDHRRRNRSLEGLQENANRLKAYKTNLVLFPRRNKKPRAGDTPREEAEQVGQLKGPILPSTKDANTPETISITDEMRGERAYYRLRLERANKKHLGLRNKRIAEAEAAEKDKAK